MDVKAYADAAVSGVPLLFVVMGLVTLIGKAGVKGTPQLLSSFGVGLVLGGCYMVAQTGVPADFAAWFSVAFYGLGLGVVATGGYETAKKLLSKY
jgi:hypothetical protein